jgi:predicted enzyme related to lactoylglutathione lyase
VSNVTRTYFMLNVVDMARAVAFYKEVLGPVIRYESETWTEIKIGDATVALHAGGGGPRPSGLTVEVLDLDEACEAVVRMGGEVGDGPLRQGTMVLAEVLDSEGNAFTLVAG